MQSPSVILLSQMDVLRRQAEVVANNIANLNTTAFKGKASVFETFVSRPRPDAALDMVMDRATFRNTLNGPLLPTENPLDVGMNGSGYFALETAQGVQYTRSGSFTLNTDGLLVTQEGFPVLDDGGGRITIPAGAQEINIAADGSISTELGALGRLSLNSFAREQDMVEMGGGRYRTDEAPVPATDTEIVQGVLEQSNVNPIQEITQLMEVNRRYQSTQRAIDTENERLRRMVQVLGGRVT